MKVHLLSKWFLLHKTLCTIRYRFPNLEWLARVDHNSIKRSNYHVYRDVDSILDLFHLIKQIQRVIMVLANYVVKVKAPRI